TFTGQPWITMRGLMRTLSCGCDWLIGILNTRCYTDSPSQRKFLIEQRIIKAERLFVIGAGSLAGVDTQRFDRNRFSHRQRKSMRHALSIPDGVPVLLFVGRITIDKGV